MEQSPHLGALIQAYLGMVQRRVEVGTRIGTGQEGTARYWTRWRMAFTIEKSKVFGLNYTRWDNAIWIVPAFKTGALNHSATHPFSRIRHLPNQSVGEYPQLVPEDRDHDHVAQCTNITAVARAQRMRLPASPQVVRRHRRAVGIMETPEHRAQFAETPL